ncbi:MAG TPA: serine hydrolase domain-containing protein [Vicinamibacterales bacterium]|nr:serine hydrolase domain-containing protein [Vicinamibacterales bacterium]
MSVPADVVRLLEEAVAARVFPGAAIECGRSSGIRAQAAVGRLTYDPDSPAASPDTIYDLASLTKVIATATLAMRAVEQDTLGLGVRVRDRLADWTGSDRETVTVRDLLEHASGLTGYLPFFRDVQGRPEFQRAICTLPLEYPPRSRSIYSDLGFMLLGFLLEDAAGRPLEAQFERVAAIAAPEPLAFNPPRTWRARTAPTETDPWRGRLLQGEVHDENTWALGGAAGHAGLFGTAAAVGRFAAEILKGLRGGVNGLARAETILRFAQKSGVPHSSRALGWDTMLPTSSCGTLMSPRAIGHTGFTGTSLWIDPELDLYVILLTNRVHPTRDGANAIQQVRRAVHDAVVRSGVPDPSSPTA